MLKKKLSVLFPIQDSLDIYQTEYIIMNILIPFGFSKDKITNGKSK